MNFDVGRLFPASLLRTGGSSNVKPLCHQNPTLSHHQAQCGKILTARSVLSQEISAGIKL
jgi:hypothetical protein